MAFFHLVPFTSMPFAFRVASAALARSVRKAPVGSFLITPNCREIEAVRVNAVWFMIPTPCGDGQISAFTSFICQVW